MISTYPNRFQGDGIDFIQSKSPASGTQSQSLLYHSLPQSFQSPLISVFLSLHPLYSDRNSDLRSCNMNCRVNQVEIRELSVCAFVGDGNGVELWAIGMEYLYCRLNFAAFEGEGGGEARETRVVGFEPKRRPSEGFRDQQEDDVFGP